MTRLFDSTTAAYLVLLEPTGAVGLCANHGAHSRNAATTLGNVVYAATDIFGKDDRLRKLVRSTDLLLSVPKAGISPAPAEVNQTDRSLILEDAAMLRDRRAGDACAPVELRARRCTR
jgi:hypothetical protein